MLSIRTILHPTDFSDFSAYAFQLACALARDHRARLIVAHVLPEPLAAPTTADRPVEEYMVVKEKLEETHSHPKIRLEHCLLVGDTAEEICRLAEESHTQLIVMGTHGRSGLNRLLMGSVAEQLVRHAPCPVLTVKAPLRIVRRKRAVAAVNSAVATASHSSG